MVYHTSCGFSVSENFYCNISALIFIFCIMGNLAIRRENDFKRTDNPRNEIKHITVSSRKLQQVSKKFSMGFHLIALNCVLFRLRPTLSHWLQYSQVRLGGQSVMVTGLFSICYKDQPVLSSLVSQNTFSARRKPYLCTMGTLISSTTAVNGTGWRDMQEKERVKENANSILGWAVYTSKSSLNLLPSACGQRKEGELILRDLQNNNNNRN